MRILVSSISGDDLHRMHEMYNWVGKHVLNSQQVHVHTILH